MLFESGFSFFIERWVSLKETQKVLGEGHTLIVRFLFTVLTSRYKLPWITHTHIYFSRRRSTFFTMFKSIARSGAESPPHTLSCCTWKDKPILLEVSVIRFLQDLWVSLQDTRRILWERRTFLFSFRVTVNHTPYLKRHTRCSLKIRALSRNRSKPW